MLLVFENFGGRTPRNTKLKNFKIKTQEKLKNTLKTHKNTKLKIFEKHRKTNKKTPNLKFGTGFNRKIIFEKDFKKKIRILKF